MALRILHTSDWHLGATLENAPRDEEHQRFLDWLLRTLEEERIDVLIVAGDVFQYAQPSTEAQRLYYQFLARAGMQTHVRQVVVVGGNHDSPARLDAPREVLDVLRVHVVGGLTAHTSPLDRCICPVAGRDGGIDAVIVAVPFVHEFRLGIRTTGRAADEIAVEFKRVFSQLYTDLADRAEALYPGRPLIATGHLTCTGAMDGDYQSEIHQIGTIGALPGDIFDPRFAYVALGHVHRMFPIAGSRARYSGSPLAMNVVEARTPRYVVRIDLEDAPDDRGDRTRVTCLPVPVWREILELEGSLPEVVERLRNLTTPHDLPPFIYASLWVNDYTPDAHQQLTEVLETLPPTRRPRLVDVRQRVRPRADQADAPAPQATRLPEFAPEEVFSRLHQARHGVPPGSELLIAFRTVISLVESGGALEEERTDAS